MSHRCNRSVALEWDHQTALDNLMHKGGWEGEIGEEDRKKARVERYEVDRVVLTYKVNLVKALNARVVGTIQAFSGIRGTE